MHTHTSSGMHEIQKSIWFVAIVATGCGRAKNVQSVISKKKKKTEVTSFSSFVAISD